MKAASVLGIKKRTVAFHKYRVARTLRRNARTVISDSCQPHCQLSRVLFKNRLRLISGYKIAGRPTPSQCLLVSGDHSPHPALGLQGRWLRFTSNQCKRTVT